MIAVRPKDTWQLIQKDAIESTESLDKQIKDAKQLEWNKQGMKAKVSHSELNTSSSVKRLSVNNAHLCPCFE